MKNSRVLKFLALLLSLALVVGAAVVVAVLANDITSGEGDTTDKVGIAAVNLNFEEKHQLVYAVRADKDYLAQTDGTLCLLFWDHNPEADGTKTAMELYRSAQDRKFTKSTMDVNGEECYVFTSSGVALGDLATPVYVIPVVRHATMTETPDSEDGSSVNYTFTYTKGYTKATVGEGGETVYDYTARDTSVANYAVQQLLETNVPADATAEEIAKINNKLALYTNLVNLAGQAATEEMGYQIVGITNADYGSTAEGALFATYSAISSNPFYYMDVAGLETAQSYSLRAEVVTDEGYFLGWANQDGVKLSDRRFINLSVSKDGYIIDGVVYDHTSAVTMITPIYGDAGQSAYNTFDAAGDTVRPVNGSADQSIVEESSNKHLNINKYAANGLTGELKVNVGQIAVADGLKVGDVYVTEFDIRFNDLISAIYTVDEQTGYYNVTNVGSGWWTYFGFSDADTYNDDNDCSSISNYGPKDPADSTGKKYGYEVATGADSKIRIFEDYFLFSKPFDLDTYGDWVTVRVEFEIKAVEGENVTSLEQRFYVNNSEEYLGKSTTATYTSNSVKYYKIQSTTDKLCFWIKFKSVGNTTTTERLAGYDFDLDNITFYSYTK